jgi:uncharacterized protein involved in exopolysaccharide biosynthesis
MSRIDQALHRKQSVEEQARGAAETAPLSIADQYRLDQFSEEPPRPEGPAIPWAQAADDRPPSATYTMPPTVDGDEPHSADPDRLIDVRQLVSVAQFAGRAVWRRKVLAFSTFILVLSATVAAVELWPRTYHVQAKVLAQRIGMMPALSNPSRAIPPDADSPTRSAAEVILGHDNLVAIVDKTDLTRRWQLTRPPILHLKDRAFNILRGAPTDEERRDALVGLLEQRLAVSILPEETISIDVDWPDRQLAYELVRTAVDNFLEARRTGEASAIGESVTILERSADMLQRDVNAKFAELQAAQALRSQTSGRRGASGFRAGPAPTTARSSAAGPALPADALTAGGRSKGEAEAARRRMALESKRQELARLEEARRQQLLELQTQLARDLTIYTENHPAIVNLRGTIASISGDSSQLVAVRDETLAMEAEYESSLDSERTEPQKTGPMMRAEDVPVVLPERDDDEANPMVMRLKGELTELADIRARLESARIELATSRAAFKYRYTVVRPAQLPRGPIKPNVPAVLVAGFLGALLLALAAPVGLDLLGGELPASRPLPRELGMVTLAGGGARQ